MTIKNLILNTLYINKNFVGMFPNGDIIKSSTIKDYKIKKDCIIILTSNSYYKITGITEGNLVIE
jgi:hypothetical protein